MWAVSDIERDIIALPQRHGGLGIRNPVKTCKDRYDLTRMIYNQDTDLSMLNKELVMTNKKEVKAEKKNRVKESFHIFYPQL